MTTPHSSFSGALRPLGGLFVPQNVRGAVSVAVSLVFLLAITFSAIATPYPAAAATAAIPEHRQVITVSVSSASSTHGTLRTWRWSAKQDRYVRVGKPIRAYVGSAGVGAASEYISRTPAGVFTLTEAFGRLADPGSRLPYRQVDRSSWWVSDVDSRHYNTYRECTPGTWCGFRQSRSEQLGAIDPYTYSIVIDYNRDPVIPGAGSAFFLHESEGKPTQGCVSIPRDRLRAILRWLSADADPVISIGVGRSATNVLRDKETTQRAVRP